MSKSHKIKVGVAGVGHLGKFHVQQYHNIDNVICMGIFDTNAKVSSEIAQKYNI